MTKIVIAIINNDDSHSVVHNLIREGYPVTKLSTTGGFLRVGNLTILVGVEEEKLQNVINIISKYSRSRKQVLPASEMGTGGIYSSIPIEVNVGGATVFVLDVENFLKV